MKLHITDHFPCTPEVFWEMFWDDDFNAKLDATAAVERTLLREWEEGALKCWRMRFTPDRELPKAVAKLLGSDRLVYEQESRLDEARGRLAWRVIPAVMTDKVRAEGTTVVTPSGDGCVRVVDGEVSVKVPLIGGRVEKQIVQNVEESYVKTAEAIREWIAGR